MCDVGAFEVQLHRADPEPANEIRFASRHSFGELVPARARLRSIGGICASNFS
jgi:hypothetical protein